jgi:hypothetical protein
MHAVPLPKPEPAEPAEPEPDEPEPIKSEPEAARVVCVCAVVPIKVKKHFTRVAKKMLASDRRKATLAARSKKHTTRLSVILEDCDAQITLAIFNKWQHERARNPMMYSCQYCPEQMLSATARDQHVAVKHVSSSS